MPVDLRPVFFCKSLEYSKANILEKLCPEVDEKITSPCSKLHSIYTAQSK